MPSYTSISNAAFGNTVYKLRCFTLVLCKFSYYYLLTPWCRVLLEQLTGLQLVKKFPAFHGTRRFITSLTSVRHLSLSWASPIQSIYPHPTSWRTILILSTRLRLGLPNGHTIERGLSKMKDMQYIYLTSVRDYGWAYWNKSLKCTVLSNS